MSKNQLTFCLLLFASILSAQSDLKIGQWKSHLPYYIGRSITQSETQVFYASPWSIFTLDKEDESPQFLSKVEGLSDVGMGILRYAPAHETLIASYENSNIDLIKPTRIVNLPFIKENVSIIGDKEIFNIYMADDDHAYLACGFGIIELNVDKEEFGFTTIMNLKVEDVIIYEGDFYAATPEGIYRATNNGLVNLQDFGNWDLLGEAEGFPGDYSANCLEAFNDKLYITINDTLFEYQNSTLTNVYTDTLYTMRFLSAEGEHLLLGQTCKEENCSGKVLLFDEDLNITPSGSSCVSRTHYAIEDQNGKVWYSDRWDDIRIAQTPGGDCARRHFETPYTHHAVEIVVDKNSIYLTTKTSGADSNNGLYEFTDGEWIIHNSLFNSQLNTMKSVNSVAVHPENGKVYVGEFWDGLWEKDGDNFTKLDDSPLAESSLERVQLGGIAFDDNNDLWITNFEAPRPLAVLRNDGTWASYALPFNTLQDIVIDHAGNKWCKVLGGSQGVIVFNEVDPTMTTGSLIKTMTTANSALPTNRVNCMAVDLDGDVWVGTESGVVVFECGSNATDDQCRGSRRIVEVDGFNAYLLETESVQTIAIDGANRKWFGTTNGVFVQSPNGEERIAFFDKDNSPLFDNNITDIAVNHETGEVFIGTASGMVSIRAEAIGGGNRHESSVYAFPNPVRPDYSGPIAIKGLPRDADVKITDVRGQLIYETTALGGQAIWDGKDYNGRKAASGVYLVFSTSKEILNTPDAEVTKILFIK